MWMVYILYIKHQMWCYKNMSVVAYRELKFHIASGSELSAQFLIEGLILKNWNSFYRFCVRKIYECQPL